MALSGDIQTFSVAAVGRMIQSEKKTGVLKVSSGGHFTQIYFSNGAIVFIEGDLAEALSLGELLLAEKWIDAESYRKARGLVQTSGRALETVLLEQGLVSEEHIVQALRYQFKEAAARMLTWKEGIFDYQDGLDGFIQRIHLEIDPARLMAEAEKWKEYRILIPNDRAVFRIKEDAVRSGSFSGESVHRVMLMIDGSRSVADIIRETGLSRAGVYKAIQALFARGAVEREAGDIQAEAETLFSSRSTLQFFLKMVENIMADLSLELGQKKSAAIWDKGIQASSHCDFFSRTIRVGESTQTHIQRMHAWMTERKEDIPPKNLYHEFRNILAFLLIEEYHLLGFKAFTYTIQRMVELADTLPQDEKEMADSVISFLSRVLDGQTQPAGTQSVFRGSGTSGETKSDRPLIPFPMLSQIGGATVIAYYSRVIEIVMDDLENAIGSKAGELIRSILESSAYHEKFLSQFNAKDDVKTNVERIRQYISAKGYRLGKISFINGFQQVLIELLRGEKHLLGLKSARASIMKLQSTASTFKQKEFRQLTEHLLLTIKSHGDLS